MRTKTQPRKWTPEEKYKLAYLTLKRTNLTEICGALQRTKSQVRGAMERLYLRCPKWKSAARDIIRVYEATLEVCPDWRRTSCRSFKGRQHDGGIVCLKWAAGCNRPGAVQEAPQSAPVED